MKKLALMAVAGMGLVLAGCNGTANIDDTKGTITNWRLDADVKNVNSPYEELDKGTYVICDNGTTEVQTSVNWTQGTEKIQLMARGLKTGDVNVVGNYMIKNPTQGGSGDIIFDFEEGTAPLSIGAQSITVNPITRDVDVKGYTNLGVRTINSAGMESSISWSDYKFPVLTCTTN